VSRRPRLRRGSKASKHIAKPSRNRVPIRRTPLPTPGDAVGELVDDILAGVAQLFLACGVSPKELSKRAIEAFADLPAPTTSVSDAEIYCLRHAPHALTHWHADPVFLDATGQPRALPLRGACSITSLAAAASAKLDAQELLDFLKRYGAVKRVRAGWLPTSQGVTVSGHRAHQSVRGLLLIRGLLRNSTHNAMHGNSPEGWFERLAENAHIPASQRAILYRKIDALGAQMLTHIDLDMRQREKPELPSEEKSHVAVGVYLFEE